MYEVLDGYEDARQMFEAVRAAATEHDRLTRRAATMRERLGVKAQGYEPSVSGTREDVNGTAATIALVDFEERNRRRLEHDRAMMSAAQDVIYGVDDNTGVTSYVGALAADCLFLYACGALSWREVAQETGVTVNTARAKAGSALDALDFHGWRFVATGQAWGQATD